METKKTLAAQKVTQLDISSPQSSTAQPNVDSSRVSSLSLTAKNVESIASGAWLVQAISLAKLRDRDGAEVSTALKLTKTPQPVAEYAQALFLGILGRCVIRGHDVHLLTADDEVAKHYKTGEPVPVGFEKARDFILSQNLAGGLAVLVFTDHLEILFPDGTTSVAIVAAT